MAVVFGGVVWWERRFVYEHILVTFFCGIPIPAELAVMLAR
jgi:hypothetical protein